MTKSSEVSGLYAALLRLVCLRGGKGSPVSGDDGPVELVIFGSVYFYFHKVFFGVDILFVGLSSLSVR